MKKQRQKNAAMCISINFDENHIKNFILSFREHNIHDDLIFFVESTQIPNLEKHFYKYNVIFKAYCFHDLCGTPIHNSRHIKYLEFLTDHNNYKNIFLCDCKDIIFQSDPFANLDGEFLYLFQEDKGVTYADDFVCNGGWILFTYGEEALKNINHHHIICAGTILGSYNKIMKLLERIRKELLRIKEKDAHIFKEMIMDQAIVNYLARLDEDFSKEVTVKENGDLVATLGWTFVDEYKKDEILMNGYHLLLNRKEPAIVHQYDRHQLLKEIFDDKYQLK